MNCLVYKEEEITDVARIIAKGCNDPSMSGLVVIQISYKEWLIEASICNGSEAPDVESEGVDLCGKLSEVINFVSRLIEEKKSFVTRIEKGGNKKARVLKWTIRENDKIGQ